LTRDSYPDSGKGVPLGIDPGHLFDPWTLGMNRQHLLDGGIIAQDSVLGKGGDERREITANPDRELLAS
jgi:hypothetical protein